MQYVSKDFSSFNLNLFQIRVCVISARKPKHVDVTTMFTYSQANTPLRQSKRAYYLSYFMIKHTDLYRFLSLKFQNKFRKCEVVNKYSHKIYFISHKHPIHKPIFQIFLVNFNRLFQLVRFFPISVHRGLFLSNFIHVHMCA